MSISIIAEKDGSLKNIKFNTSYNLLKNLIEDPIELSQIKENESNEFVKCDVIDPPAVKEEVLNKFLKCLSGYLLNKSMCYVYVMSSKNFIINRISPSFIRVTDKTNNTIFDVHGPLRIDFTVSTLINFIGIKNLDNDWVITKRSNRILELIRRNREYFQDEFCGGGKINFKSIEITIDDSDNIHIDYKYVDSYELQALYFTKDQFDNWYKNVLIKKEDDPEIISKGIIFDNRKSFQTQFIQGTIFHTISSLKYIDDVFTIVFKLLKKDNPILLEKESEITITITKDKFKEWVSSLI